MISSDTAHLIAPRWRKVLRELWINKTRTALVVLSIAVGIFAIGALMGARTILARDLRTQYEASYEASFSVQASDLDEQFVRAVARMPEVADAQGRSVYVLRVHLGEGRSNLILYTVWDFNALRLDRFWHEQGARVPSRREILLERSTLRLFNKQIGDTLTIELPDGKTRELRIVGTVFDINAPPVLFANFGSGYISPETLEWLGFPKRYTEVRVRVAHHHTDREHLQRVADLIKERVEDSGRLFFGASIPQAPGRHYAEDQLQSMLLILAALGALALFLSGFLVVNTTTSIVAQQIKHIGIMKSVGARTPQIASLYLATVAVFGVLAMLIALPLGTLGALWLVSFVAGLLNFDVLTRTPPLEVVLMEIGVGLLLPLLAALSPVLTGARITVREAITATGLSDDTSARTKLRLPRLPLRLNLMVLLERWVSRPMLLSIRNTFRRKTRLALTMGTLVLASAIFIAVFTVRDSLNRSLEISLRYWQYDVEVTLRSFQGEDRALNAARQVPGVTYAEAWSTGSARRVRDDGSESRVIDVIAPPADTRLLQPLMLRGRWLLPEDTDAVVVNTEVLDDNPDLDLGDTLTLRFGTRNVRVRIVGVTQSVLTGQIRNPRVIYMNREGYRAALFTGRQVRTIVLVTEHHDGAFQAQVARDVESAFRAANMPVQITETLTERREQITFQFDLLITFLILTAVLLAIVGGLGLAGTMSINVLERTREIGVMRAIGASDSAIRRIIIGEGLVIGALSWFLGAVLAFPIGRVMCEAVGLAFMRRPLDFAYSWGGALLWLAALLAVATVSSLAPAWRASRLTVREVLAYE
ncbi:MAG: FtsX-like permease family protein [Anaerolineae bacterium]|nr:ABC transporter permease [Thermoflexales bacterium]MDW8293379.1 FtsX-like permease family protein [Anaerolineae bacterium]